MAGFNHIKRCLELADRDIVFAMEDRLVAKALLDRLAAVSKPNEGGPKVLLVFARMASQACDWIDGDLRIEIVGDHETSVIEVLTDLGAGMRERVLPSFAVKIPLEEFSRAVERVPHMVEPLTVAAKSARRIVLSATEEMRKSSLPPAMVEIDRESLYERADLSSAKVPVFAPPPASSRAMPVSKSTPRMEAVRPKAPSVVKKGEAPKRSSRPPPKIGEGASSRAPSRSMPAAPVSSRSIPAAPQARSMSASPNPAPASSRIVAARPMEAPKVDAPAPARPQIQPFAKFVPPGRAAAAPAKASPPAKAKTVPPPKAKAVPPPKAKTLPPPKAKTLPPPAKGKGTPSRAPRAMLSEPPDEEQIDTGWDDEG